MTSLPELAPLNMRAAAVAAASRGLTVVKLRPLTKRPIEDEWQKGGVSDPLEAFEAWTLPDGTAGDWNPGIVCRGMVALDFDVKSGGLEAVEVVKRLIGGFPRTFTVRTRGGGLHVYFKAPPGVTFSNSSGSLPKGVDVRGEGGQCVAPGAAVLDADTGALGTYRVEVDAPIAEIPEALAAMLRVRAERGEDGPASLGVEDAPGAEEKARDYIARLAPEAVQGERDNTAYRVAARLYDFGVSPATCRELLDEWNVEKCSPSLEDEALDRIAGSARTSRQNAVGALNPLAGFTAIEEPPEAPCPELAEDFRNHIVQLGVSSDMLKAIPPRQWLVKGVLQGKKVTLLIAPGGSGKSLFTLNTAVALAVGDGRKFGLDVHEQTKVLLINAEDDLDEMNRRLGALALHHGYDNDAYRGQLLSYSLGPMAPRFQLVERDKNRQIIEHPKLSAIAEYLGNEGVGAVVIDPLVACHCANENDNAEMNIVMSALTSLAQRANIAVLLVHHTKKPSQADAGGFAGVADSGRGASAIVNAARSAKTLFRMTVDEAKALGVDPSERTSYVRLDDAKGNYSPDQGQPTWFKIKSVPLPNGDDAPAMAPATFQIDKSTDERRRKVFVAIVAKSRSGQGYSTSEGGTKVASAAIARELGQPLEIVKSDLERLVSMQRIERYRDDKNKERWRPTKSGEEWFA